MKKTSNKITAATILIWAVVLLCFSSARAANFTVNQAGDAGDLTCDATCTLRDAIDDANNASTDDTINFAAGLTTITLTDEIVIANNGTLSINGTGANVLTIDGGAGTNRIFFINQNAIVNISGVTLTGGNGTGSYNNSDGGAIFAYVCTLRLFGVHVTGNTAANLGGGVIFFSGVGGNPHIISDSTFSNNSAGNNQIQGSGGALYSVYYAINIDNSTFSGNSANGAGGAMYLTGVAAALRSVTVTGNTAGNAGGLQVNAGASLDFGNSIIAGNTTNSNLPPEINLGQATATSAGYNLVGDSAGDAANTGNPVTYQSIDLRDIDPRLGPLQNNGGGTPTHALQFNMSGVSPAIDKGNSFGENTDQRGFARPVNSPSIPNAADNADIGAFEEQAPTATSVSIGGRVTTFNGRGISRAQITLTDSSGETRAASSNFFGYFRFEEVSAGETYVINVRHKSYQFSQPTQVLFVSENLLDINFTASPFKIFYSSGRLID